MLGRTSPPFHKVGNGNVSDQAFRERFAPTLSVFSCGFSLFATTGVVYRGIAVLFVDIPILNLWVGGL